MTQALMLIARKASGIDCTEDESAAIKAFFDTHPLTEGVARELAEWFPVEYAEWAEEKEEARR